MGCCSPPATRRTYFESDRLIDEFTRVSQHSGVRRRIFTVMNMSWRGKLQSKENLRSEWKEHAQDTNKEFVLNVATFQLSNVSSSSAFSKYFDDQMPVQIVRKTLIL